MDDAEFDGFVTPVDYPMYVLTVPGGSGADRSGCLVGFATQCSISPPRFLVCVSKKNHTHQAAGTARVAALHLLGAADHDLAELFGGETGDEIDKFDRCAWTEGPGGVPLLARCSTWLVGVIENRVDLGDHEGLLLAPTHVGTPGDGTALMFSAVRDLEAGHSA